MDAAHCLRELEKLAARLGISIRVTEAGASGFCTLRGSRVLMIDRDLDDRGKIDLMVEVLRTQDLEETFVMPVIRDLLEGNNAEETP